MKTKFLLINVIALLAAIAVFGSSFIYAASNIEQVTISSSDQTSTDDNFLQQDVGIGDLLFASSNTSSENSSELSSEESSELVSSTPSSKVSSTPASKPKPPSSQLPSSESSSIPSSEPSSEESSESEVVSPPTVDNELLMILSGAVQREIVGTNTVPAAKYYEAYKAQAVACHSYMEYYKRQTGSYPTMSYSTPHQKTIELVASVLNEVMYYNGSVINASFHAASGGQTQSASYVWSGNIPYLKGVTSAYDDYNSTCSISTSELRDKLSAFGISVDGDPSTWFQLNGATYTDGGFVNTIPVGNSVITGRKLRENVIGSARLKSCKILNISVSGDNIIFTTKGYGHGAGMSQLGAMGYAANEGWGYRQILTHYYTGITIA